MQAELESLRQKLEKSEKERQEFKLSVDRLETKVHVYVIHLTASVQFSLICS